jgi:hypothetical protein
VVGDGEAGAGDAAAGEVAGDDGATDGAALFAGAKYVPGLCAFAGSVWLASTTNATMNNPAKRIKFCFIALLVLVAQLVLFALPAAPRTA